MAWGQGHGTGREARDGRKIKRRGCQIEPSPQCERIQSSPAGTIVVGFDTER